MWGKGGSTDGQPLWKALSEQYANGASGVVTYAHPEDYLGAMWRDVESRVIKDLAKEGIVTEIMEVFLNGKKLCI